MGARACGKTTLGQRVALRLGLPFVDLDDRTRSMFPERTIRDVWIAHGEEAWRQAEEKALRHALVEPPSILALGGGTPTIPAAYKVLDKARQAGKIRVIYLECSAQVLQGRLQHQSGDRATLTGLGVVEEVPVLLAAREPIYRALADGQINTGPLTPEEAIDALIALVDIPRPPVPRLDSQE